VKVLLLLFFLPVATLHAERPPNIVLIFTDDQGYTDLGIYGFDPDVRTPNLDQLARDGVLFTHGYVTAPQCVPSRAGLLTGRHQNAFGMDDNHKGPLPLSEVTIADRLQEVGYATGMVGKWHLEPRRNSSHHEWDGVSHEPYYPRNRGFEDYWAGEINTYEVNYRLDGSDHPDAPVMVTDNRLRVDVQTEAALAFLERRKTDERPFFLYLAWFAPHAPLATQRQLENGINGQNYWQQMAHVEETKRRHGLAIIKAVDYGLGLVRDKLNEMGVAENTLIFFISDNGAPLRPTSYIGSHNQPLIGEKGMETDGGQRVPFIAAWPGTIAPNQVLSQTVSSLEASATVLAVANATNNITLIEGKNLMPWMLGAETGPVHETLYWRWRTQCAIRKGNWKFVRLGDQYRWLFDMTAIGRETLADCKLKEFPQLAADLEQELLDHANTNWHFKGLPTAINSQDLQFYADHVGFPDTGVDPLLDSDGDGMSDAKELSTGRNPFSASDLGFEFETDDDYEGWTPISDGFLSDHAVAGGRLSGQASTSQGKFEFYDFNFPADDVANLVIRIKSPTASGLTFRWGHTQANNFVQARTLTASYPSNTWNSVVIPLKGHPEWDGKTITRMRINPVNGAADFEVDWIRGSTGDLDGDLLPDTYEWAMGLDAANPADGNVDADGDGYTRGQEYVWGTSDNDPNSFLRPGLSAVGDGLFLSWPGVAGRWYNLWHTEDLVAGPWSKVYNIGPLASDGVIEVPVEVPAEAGQAFFRVDVGL
jgi:arylsulfatase A-like enzyme